MYGLGLDAFPDTRLQGTLPDEIDRFPDPRRELNLDARHTQKGYAASLVESSQQINVGILAAIRRVP
jgi:hypothetical protein